VNEERDVLFVVPAGSLRLTVGEEVRELEAAEATIVEKGVLRTPVAGPDGVRYLTAHTRRGALELKRF
jgi:quercetin dioxygenase-like cupin family protein